MPSVKRDSLASFQSTSKFQDGDGEYVLNQSSEVWRHFETCRGILPGWSSTFLPALQKLKSLQCCRHHQAYPTQINPCQRHGLQMTFHT